MHPRIKGVESARSTLTMRPGLLPGPITSISTPIRAPALSSRKSLARSAVEQRRAAGKGIDLILRGDAVSGTCLWEGGAVRHMAVFAQ
jgi:hypothetical protein